MVSLLQRSPAPGAPWQQSVICPWFILRAIRRSIHQHLHSSMIFLLSPALSSLSAPTAPRSAIGHRAVVSGITRTVTKGGKMTTALARLVPQPRFTFCGLGSLASNIAPDFQSQ
jgi:hypothetical protein